MSPRSRAAANPIQDPSVVLDGSGSPFGHWWKPGPSLGSYGGNDASALHTPRQLTVSASIIGSVIPVYYGAREMLAAGQWWLWYRTDDTSWNAFAIFALSEGELGSISEIKLNDIDIADLVGAYITPEKYVLSYESEVGSNTQAAPTFLTGTGGIPGYVEDLPGLAYVAIKLNTTDESPIPSSIRLTAKVTGRKISDFRTGGAAAATSNPVAIAYDLLTNTEFGLGVSASLIDTGAGSSWNDAADHCDTAMSDSTGRYEWNGPLYERDLFAAIQTVLGHALMELQFDTESGKYIIATSESGLSSVATISESDWRTMPKWREIPLAERPNHITAYYTRADTFDRASVTVEDPSGVTGADMRRIEINLPGCYNASIATRVAVKKYNHAATEKFRWFGRLGPVIADVLPGQIVTLNTRKLSSQLARLVTKQLVQGSLDSWECEFVEYDSATDSTAVATDDTPISIVVDPPDPPTDCDIVFGEAGDWDTGNEVPDANDITTSQGWTIAGSASSVYYGGGDKYTILTLASGGTGTELANIKYDLGAALDEDQLYVVTFLAKTTEVDADFEAGWDSLSATEQGKVTILADGRLHRYRIMCRGNNTFSHNYIFFSGTRQADAQDLTILRLRVRPVVFTPSLKLYERMTWTEGATAATTVEYYRAANIYGRELGRVGVGSIEMEVESFTFGLIQVPTYQAAFPEGQDDCRWTAVGPTGLVDDFPTPTTETPESRLFSGTIKEQGDTDFTSLATGDLQVYNATSEKWENSTLADLGIDDSDVDLSGTHTGLLSELSGTGTVAGAMTVLDDLVGSDIDIDDEDVDVTGGYSNLLSGDTTLDAALDTIDALSIEMPTRQQVMNGSKASVSDNTSTTIVTFTMPTGPSSLAVGLTFVGETANSTDTGKVVIQGWLMAVRNSTGTVTAEWVETFNDDKATGTVTFGTNEADATVSTADCQMKVTLDSSLNQSWTVKWTALMSNDVTVTAA